MSVCYDFLKPNRILSAMDSETVDLSDGDHSSGRTDLSRPGKSELRPFGRNTILPVLRPLPEKSRTGGRALGPLWGHFARGFARHKGVD